MNTFHLTNPNEQFELEELESWGSQDFDDVLPKMGLSESENELIQNNFGWYVGSFQ